jgi:hypothetical protein
MGLGDILLKHAEGLARSLGVGETRLYTNARFTANLVFYAKRGYCEFRRETLAAGTVLVHMRKPVTDGAGPGETPGITATAPEMK